MTTYPKDKGMNKETIRKELKIIYDVESVPNGLTLLKVFELKAESGYLFYSSKKGKRPEIIDPEVKATIVDTHDNVISYDLKEKTITFKPLNDGNDKTNARRS